MPKGMGYGGDKKKMKSGMKGKPGMKSDSKMKGGKGMMKPKAKV